MNLLNKVFDEAVMFDCFYPEGWKGRLWCAWQVLRGNVQGVILFIPTKKWRKKHDQHKRHS